MRVSSMGWKFDMPCALAMLFCALSVISSIEAVREREARQGGGEVALSRAVAPKRRASGAAIDIESSMKRLPARAREVFVLYDVEGYSHDEIATQLGVSVGTSKSQLHRARMLMREQLDR